MYQEADLCKVIGGRQGQIMFKSPTENRHPKMKHVFHSQLTMLPNLPSSRESPPTLASCDISPRSVIAISKKKTCPGKEKKKPQKTICRCVKSRCLKLYCVCFQNGNLCGPECQCVSCLNNKTELAGKLMKAKQDYLRRKPDAFMKKVKDKNNTSCACRTNRCLKKYCDCFRHGKVCSMKCTCVDCLNLNIQKLKLKGKEKKLQKK